MTFSFLTTCVPGASHKAFCGVIHVTCGAEDWDPTDQELDEISDLFVAAFEAQREGGYAIVVTSDAVSSQVLCDSTISVVRDKPKD
jgi:hypothetical protein